MREAERSREKLRKAETNLMIILMMIMIMMITNCMCKSFICESNCKSVCVYMESKNVVGVVCENSLKKHVFKTFCDSGNCAHAQTGARFLGIRQP